MLFDAALAEMRPPLTPELIARSKLAAAIAAHREAPGHTGQWVFCADCKAAPAR